MIGDGDLVATVHTTHGQRPDGQRLESLGTLVWRFEGGTVVETTECFFDRYAEDAFWGGLDDEAVGATLKITEFRCRS